MREMLEDLLRTWKSHQGHVFPHPPDTVLYFRAGVSDGQIASVLDAEYQSVKASDM